MLPVHAGDGIVRVELQRPVIVGDSTVVVALLFVNIAAIDVGNGIFRIEPDRLVEGGDCTVVIVSVHIGVTAKVVR